jgi:hypothetical protein
VKRAVVRGLAAACGALDAVTHRRLAMRLVPGVRRCRLARFSLRLDERWGTGVWPEGTTHAVPLLPCAACYRRPATHTVAAEEGWLRRHPVELCNRCQLETTTFEHAEDLVRALRRAAR